MKKDLIKFLFVFFFLFANAAFAGFPASPALVSLMEQCQKTYLKPNGTDFGQLSKTTSLVNIAIVFGYGMQTQRKLSEQSKYLKNSFAALEKDVYVLLEWLVNKRNGIDINGKPIMTSDLIEVYKTALNGHLNTFATQNYKVNPTRVLHKSVLNLETNAKAEPVRQSGGHGIVAPPDNAQPFKLLGVASGDRVKKTWDSRQKFSADVIVGSWYKDNECSSFLGTFRKTKTGYYGETTVSDTANHIWRIRRVNGLWQNPKTNEYWQINFEGTRQWVYTNGKSLEPVNISFHIRVFRDTWMMQRPSGRYNLGGFSFHKPL